MWSLGALAFAAPWALAAIAALPVLWWLLRVTPPAPRRQIFPAIRLLLGLEGREDTAAHTPWWVLALRLLIALLVILTAAHPLINPGTPMPSGTGPLVLVVDDGWAAARDWQARRAAMDDILARADRAGRPVMVLTTAPAADGGKIEAPSLLSAAAARSAALALEPKPWAGDHAAALAVIKALPRDRVTQAVWISDGLAGPDTTALAAALQSLGGGLEILTGQTGRALSPPDSPVGDAKAVLRRLPQPLAETVALRALDGNGRVLAREEGTFQPGSGEIQLPLRLPAELRNRLARLDVENESGAAAAALLDRSWRRRVIGLSGGGEGNTPLLGALYYVERALEPSAELRRGEVSELTGNVSVLILADQPALAEGGSERLGRWIDEGGVLIRFAGPLLARSAGSHDPFLPVPLRDGGRTLGGTMSWTSPQGLAPFPDDGPFAGLPTPAEVRVNSQVLAEPSLELSERTWARLTDGTPLVTGARHGKGWVVLVHTSANAAWSNLALSGLFVDMLKRLADLSEGTQTAHAGAPLPPSQVLDGFGRLRAPMPAAVALTGDVDKIVPGPRHPPGLYGEAGRRYALNLGPHVPALIPLEAPRGVTLSPLDGRPAEHDLRAPLLTAALVLAMLDLVIALALRGLLGRRRSAASALLLVLLLGMSAAVMNGQAQAADTFALDAGLATRLAFVRTGDGAIDRKSEAGLRSLSAIIGERSTATLAAPMGVSLDSDPVLFFPLLYWPVTAGQKPLSYQAVEKLNAYMRAGGMIVLDTGAQSDGIGTADDSETLRALTRGLTIPPLAPVAEDHVLTRSFYLLKGMPGRIDGPVWLADGQGLGNDGVSPVVLGDNDWAGAWATDNRGTPMFAAVPGGERQREMAYRFGVNLVMYALTGNYKADQVHLPAILERLGR